MSKLTISLLALSLAAAAPLAGQEIPRKAGQFSIQVPNAKPIALADYKGKPLVLAFILTTCPHCRHCVELLIKIQPEYAKRGLSIVASAIDQNASTAVPLFLKYMHPPFPVGFDDPNAVLAFAGYPPTRLPHMPILLFVDRQGTVREQHEGADSTYFGDQEELSLRKSMDALLAPAKTAPRKTTAVPSKQ
jgi:peroxiredoxin